jgi:long-chain fatty acid transport protein
MKRSSLIAMILALTAANSAAASNEITGLFDARSGAMGGTGVAFLDSAGAIPINPALLDQIGKLTVSLNGLLFVAQPQAPYRVVHPNGMGGTYENYETIRSSPIFAPLFFVGGAYRLFERVVIGAAVYPVIGQGTSVSYHPSPELMPQLELTNKASLGMLEVGIPISVRLTDQFSVAAMWRVTYMTQTVSTPLPGMDAGGITLSAPHMPIYVDQDVTGVNFSGLQLGLLYRPARSLQLGLSYRSKITVDATGSTKLTGMPTPIPTDAPFASPHAFRAGIAMRALDEKFLFAADVKYLMYAEAFKYVVLTTGTGATSMTVKTPAFWKDAFSAQFGGEYKVADQVRVRAGYILGTTATPDAYAKAFMAPPGISHSFSAGIGIKVLDAVEVDVAGTYIVLKSKVDVATPDNAGVGIYAAHVAQFSASASFHM